MPQPGWGFATSWLDGKLHVLAGENSVCGQRTVHFAYDPSTDTWTTLANMSTKRMLFDAATLNGELYAIGGTIACGSIETAAVESYDPTSDTWTPRAPLPTTLGWGHSATPVAGKIYVIGGDAGGSGPIVPNLKTYVYDPGSDAWSVTAGSFPVIPEHPDAYPHWGAVALGNEIYTTVAHRDPPEPHFLYSYDTASDMWTYRSRVPFDVVEDSFGGPFLFVVDDYVGVIYDRKVEGQVPLYLYSPASNTWHDVDTSTLLSLNGFELFQVSGDGCGFYILGGILPGNGPKTDAVQYVRFRENSAPDFMWVVTKGFSPAQGDAYGRALYGVRADGTGGLVPLYEPAGLPASSVFFSPRIRDGQIVFHAGTDLGHPDRGNIYLGSLGSDTVQHITNFSYRNIPAGAIMWNEAKDSVLFSNIGTGISKMDINPATNDEVLLTTNYFDEVTGVSSMNQRVWFDNFMYRLPFHTYSMDQNGSGIQPCNPFTDGNYGIDGSISPDGLVLAVGKISPDLNTHFNGVWLADAETCTLLSPSQIISDTPFRSVGDGLSAWSPDSGSLAIIKDGQLWTFNADGTNYRQLTTGTFGDLRVWGAVPIPGEDCGWGDLDGDGDVDLRDYGIMQLHMTGPK